MKFRRRLPVSLHAPMLAGVALATSLSMGCATSTRDTTSEPPSIQVGGPLTAVQVDTRIDSVLGARSALNPKDGSFYQAFFLDAEAGEVLSITARSSDFDAFLAVFTQDGNLLGVNDDLTPDTTDAQIVARLPQDGRYLIVVSALETSTQGRFSLDVRALSTATSLELPGRTSGWLYPTGIQHPRTNTEVVSYELDLEAPQLVRIRAETQGFAPLITIFDPATNKVLAQNPAAVSQQGAATLSAALESGRYEILLGSHQPGQNGEFDLHVDFIEVNLVEELRIGGAIDGLLSPQSPTFAPRRAPAQPYPLRLLETSGVDIRLNSDEFDAFLVLTDAQGRQIAENDDFAGSTNARITAALDPGEYTIWAQALEDDQSGLFALVVETFEVQNAQNIEIGGAIKGLLGMQADVHPERGAFMQTYTLDLEEPAMVQIDLTSSDFDAYLILTDESGTVLEENDDRAPSILDARIRRALESGRYHVIVTAIDKENFGRFELKIE